MKRPRSLVTLLAVSALVLVVVACSDGGPAALPVSDAASSGSAQVQSDTSGAATPGTTSPGGMEYDFPTGAAVMVEVGFEPPADHVPSTGAYLPANGKPTLVLLEAIWCPNCALSRPIFHPLRPEFQDRVNFVILDFDIAEDRALANKLGVRVHPGWAAVAPNSDEVLDLKFGPQNEQALREWLNEIVEATEEGA